jgi:hypothetical protein
MSASLLGRLGAATRRRTVSRRAPLGTEPVPVAELISPLRLDIMVRVDFFRLIEAHPDLDPAAMPEVARGTAYDIWFRQVAMARYQPDVADDDQRYASAFDKRVRSATQLWRDFRIDGYDDRHPIVLRQPGPKTQLPEGNWVHRQRYMGDGCHRLAMIVATGADAVPPARYRLEPVALPRVLDNTAVLLPLLLPSEAEYAAFLGMGYGVSGPSTVAATLALIRETRGELWPEAVAIAARHGYPGEGRAGTVGRLGIDSPSGAR